MKHKLTDAQASTHQDARIVKTGVALRAAMLALLERKPLDQITIRDITAESGVHYATFFRHHPTKESLLDSVAADQIDRIVELTMPVMDAVDSEAAFVALATYVSEHRSLWTILLNGGAAGAMRDEWLRLSRIVTAERGPKKSAIPIDLVTICTTSLIVEGVAWWLRQPPQAFSNKKFGQMLYRLVLSPAEAMTPPKKAPAKTAKTAARSKCAPKPG